MAKCRLDLTHPSFVRIVEKLSKKQHDLKKGIEQAKKKIEENHMACHWVEQPMPGYPNCEGKIWKYDWAPPSIKSFTRRPWRLIVIVKSKESEPYSLVAGTVYSKGDVAQLPLETLAAIYAEISQPIAEQIEMTPPESPESDPK